MDARSGITAWSSCKIDAFIHNAAPPSDRSGWRAAPGANRPGVPPEEILERFADEKDSGRAGTEHPFVGVGGQEIDVLDAHGKGAQDGIDAEKNVALVQRPADRVPIDGVGRTGNGRRPPPP